MTLTKLGLFKRRHKLQAKDVAKLMAQYLGHTDLLDVVELDGQNQATTEQQQKLNVYLTCINDVVQSLGISYFPLKDKAVLSSENNMHSYNLFNKTLLQIIRVEDFVSKAKIRFKSYPEYFTVNSNKVKVEYCYQPEFVSGFSDELEVQKGMVSTRMIALGAVARYYLIEGLYTESTAWNNMFERAILIGSRPLHNLYINKRGWF